MDLPQPARHQARESPIPGNAASQARSRPLCAACTPSARTRMHASVHALQQPSVPPHALGPLPAPCTRMHAQAHAPLSHPLNRPQNPCNSVLHPAVEAGVEPEGEEEIPIQEAYTPKSKCFGCGERGSHMHACTHAWATCPLPSSTLLQRSTTRYHLLPAGPASPDGLRIKSFRIPNGLQAEIIIPSKYCAFPGECVWWVRSVGLVGWSGSSLARCPAPFSPQHRHR